MLDGRIYTGSAEYPIGCGDVLELTLPASTDGLLALTYTLDDYQTSALESDLDITCGVLGYDLDGDGHVDFKQGGDDHDETSMDAHSQGYEHCWDGIDNDGDGQTDSDDPSCAIVADHAETMGVSELTWDADLDGFYRQPAPGIGIPHKDCDDDNPAANPNAPEIPGNGVDEDCDFSIDEPEATSS